MTGTNDARDNIARDKRRWGEPILKLCLKALMCSIFSVHAIVKL